MTGVYDLPPVQHVHHNPAPMNDREEQQEQARILSSGRPMEFGDFHLYLNSFWATLFEKWGAAPARRFAEKYDYLIRSEMAAAFKKAINELTPLTIENPILSMPVCSFSSERSYAKIDSSNTKKRDQFKSNQLTSITDRAENCWKQYGLSTVIFAVDFPKAKVTRKGLNIIQTGIFRTMKNEITEAAKKELQIAFAKWLNEVAEMDKQLNQKNVAENTQMMDIGTKINRIYEQYTNKEIDRATYTRKLNKYQKQNNKLIAKSNNLRIVRFDDEEDCSSSDDEEMYFDNDC